MVEIRLMQQEDRKALMDYFQSSQDEYPLSIQSDDKVYLYWDHTILEGFLIMRPLTTKVMELVSISISSDLYTIQDGLLRTAFNALDRQSITWVVASHTAYQRLAVLQNQFGTLRDEKDCRDHLLEEKIYLDENHLTVAKVSRLFETACKGGH